MIGNEFKVDRQTVGTIRDRIAAADSTLVSGGV